MGIEAIYRKPNTSKPAPGHKIHPYLLRKMQAVRLVATRETLADSRSAHGDFQASLEIRNVRRHQIRPAIQRGSSLFRTRRSRRTALAHESGRADQARFRAAIVFDADEQFGASGHSGGQLRRGKRPLMRASSPRPASTPEASRTSQGGQRRQECPRRRPVLGRKRRRLWVPPPANAGTAAWLRDYFLLGSARQRGPGFLLFGLTCRELPP